MGNNHKTNNKYQGKMKFTTKTLALLMAAAVTVSCSGDGSRKNQIVPLDIDSNMTEAEIRAGILTPEVMWKMGRVGESVLSPDGKSVVYSVTWYNMQENRGLSHLYLMPSEGGEPQQLTVDAVYDHSPQWSADGKTIYFLSDRTGEGQIWAIGTNGKRIHQVSDIKGGIEGFGIAPKGDHFYYVQNVHVADIESKDVYPDLDKSKGLIYNDLMTRHWDYWDRGYYKHVFVGKFDGKEAHAGKDIMPGEAWDAPLAPYFDMKEISWNNAGTQLAYTCKKMTGTKYAQSTDSDIFVYDVAKGTVTNINKAGTPDDPRLKIAPAFPGYGSAAKYIGVVMKEIIRDATVYGTKYVTIVEIMGRNAGWLTAAAALAKAEDCEGVDMICLPEVPFNVDHFVEKVERMQKEKPSIVIAVSEGVKLEDGRYVCELADDVHAVDAFGHKALTGTARFLANTVARRLDTKTRCIELSTLQRCAGHLTSRTDITEAYQVGGAAAKAAFEGHTGEMVALDRISNAPYQCGTSLHPISEVANLEKKVPLEWVNADHTAMTDEFLAYALPLVQAELTPIYVEGLPHHIYLPEA